MGIANKNIIFEVIFGNGLYLISKEIFSIPF